MPSSPKGPCRIGSADVDAPSAAGEPADGTAGSRPRRRHPARAGTLRGGSAQAPSRPISIIWVSSVPGRAPPATERADASEIACSLERPPARTATRRRRVTASWSSSWMSCRSAAVVVVPPAGRSCRRTASRSSSDPAGYSPADPARSRPCRTSPHRCPAGVTCTLKPAAVSVAFASACVWPVDVRQRRRLRPVRDREVDRRALGRGRRAARNLAHDGLCRLVALDVGPRDGEAGCLQLRTRSNSRARRPAARRPASARSSS